MMRLVLFDFATAPDYDKRTGKPVNRMLLSWGMSLFLVGFTCVIQGQEKEGIEAELCQ